jgi:hypothetical protein
MDPDACYEKGSRLARDFGIRDGGPFDWVPGSRKRGVTYHAIL